MILQARSARGLSEQALKPPALAARGIVLVLVAVGVAAITWSAMFEIDIRARGMGQVVTASQTQVVQNLEGGIVTAIDAHNGDVVKAGQVLLKLDPKSLVGELTELQATSVGLLAAGIRLDAESNGRDPVFPKELRNRAPDVVRGEEALHRLRLAELNAQEDVIQAELHEKQAALAELRARIPSIQDTLRLINTQEKEMKSLVESNSASPEELIALRKEASAQTIQLTVAQQSIPGAAAAVAGAERRLNEKRATFEAEAMDQLTQNRVKFNALQGQLAARKASVARTTVVSPMNGVVKTMHVTTIGEVVQPGHTIAEIVPVGDSLQVEARISPSDIGFVAPGQPVDVRLSAFDHTIYGSLHGRVERISPDTVRDEADPRQIYYRVIVRTDKNYLMGRNGKLSIMPGMIADVDIQTGRRTVLDYFIKPLTRARAIALRER